MSDVLDKSHLLAVLEKPAPSKRSEAANDLMRRVSLSAALPALTEIDHEKEFQVCRGVAAHLLDKVYEPEDVELD
jgi:hypothetical protein